MAALTSLPYSESGEKLMLPDDPFGQSPGKLSGDSAFLSFSADDASGSSPEGFDPQRFWKIQQSFAARDPQRSLGNGSMTPTRDAAPAPPMQRKASPLAAISSLSAELAQIGKQVNRLRIADTAETTAPDTEADSSLVERYVPPKPKRGCLMDETVPNAAPASRRNLQDLLNESQAQIAKLTESVQKLKREASTSRAETKDALGKNAFLKKKIAQLEAQNLNLVAHLTKHGVKI